MISSQGSNAIIYLTYGVMLVIGVGIALWKSSAKSFLSNNGTRTGLPLALNFIASAMGAGVLTTYTQIANIAGIQGLLVYSLCGAIPIFLFSFFGPLIRKRCPEGFVLTEWVYQRFGPICALYLSGFTLLTMFLYMVSELTAIEYAIEALTGLDALPCIIIECVVTSIYTSIGGFHVSFITDTLQAGFVLVMMIVGVIGFGSYVHIDMSLKHETEDFLLGSNKLSWMLVYILFVAIVTNDAFLSGFWLRTFAAKTDRDLVIGTSIASLVCCIICVLVGLPGILAVWTGDLTIADDNGYNALFIMVSKMPNWVIAFILIFTVALSTCTFDSLQSATASSISNDIFRNKIPIIYVRGIVILIMAPCVAVAVKASASVLQIYLIADLVSASIIPILFLALNKHFYFMRSFDVMVGGLGALVAVFIFGTIYYGSAKEGGRLLLVWNGIYDQSDWGPFGAFVIAPFGGITIGMIAAGVRIAATYTYCKFRGKPFTALDIPEEVDTESSVSEEEVTQDVNSFELSKSP